MLSGCGCHRLTGEHLSMTISQSRIERFLAHPWAGLAVVVGALMPFVLWRCALARTFWGDEMYTVVVASLPVGELIEMCRADAHPPLYYLLIKLWLMITGVALEPSIFLVRLPNVVLWMGMCAVAWFGGRRLLNDMGGFLFAFALGGSGHGAFISGDLRQYGILVLTMTACWILLLELWRRSQDEGTSTSRTEGILWGAYAVLAAVALWTQLLSGVFLFLLGLLWIGMSITLILRHGDLLHPFITGGAAANMLALVVFLPWLVIALSNLEYMRSMGGNWMPAPTLDKLISVFLFYYPYGRSGFPTWETGSLKFSLGAATLLVPALAWYISTRVPLMQIDVRHRMQRLMAVTGIALGALFTILLWSIMRLDLMKSFYAPRYPSIAIGIWIGGLCAMCAIAYERLNNRPWVLLALAPLFLTSVYGWHFILLRQQWSEPWKLVEKDAELLPPKGTPLYVAPEALIPYWESGYGDWPLVPLSDLQSVEPNVDNATVLDLFVTKDRRREGVLFLAARGGFFSEKVERIDYPDYKRLVTILNLRELDHQHMDRIGRMPWEEAVRPSFDTAVSVAVPELQNIADGWHLPQQADHGQVFSWSARDRVALQFNRSVDPGTYTVSLWGGNPGQPHDRADFTFQFENLSGVGSVMGKGPFREDMTLRISERSEHPVLVIERESWRDPAGSTRGFVFVEAAIYPQ